MLKFVPSCLQLAAVTMLLYLTLKGVSPKALDSNNVIQKAIIDLNKIQEPWKNLSAQFFFFENENLTMVGDNAGCDDLDLSTLPAVLHALEVAQRYTHFLEGPDYVFETNCADFQTTNQQHGNVTDLIGVLIRHLTAVMMQCSDLEVESTRINCTVIGNGGSVQFPNRVEISLRDARDILNVR